MMITKTVKPGFSDMPTNTGVDSGNIKDQSWSLQPVPLNIMNFHAD